jgi:hypothetical protein
MKGIAWLRHDAPSVPELFIPMDGIQDIHNVADLKKALNAVFESCNGMGVLGRWYDGPSMSVGDVIVIVGGPWRGPYLVEPVGFSLCKEVLPFVRRYRRSNCINAAVTCLWKTVPGRFCVVVS